MVHLLALALVPKFLIIYLGIPLSFGLRVLLSFLLTVLLAALSYTWLEQPFLRLKKRFSRIGTGEDRRSVSPWQTAPLVGTLGKFLLRYRTSRAN